MADLAWYLDGRMLILLATWEPYEHISARGILEHRRGAEMLA